MPDASIPSCSAPWWHEFFDDDYAAYGLASAEAALNEQIADFIIRTLGLSAGQTLFDQCCGIGRLSLPLAQRGIHVIGVDRVPSYIDTAAREAAQRQLSCTFHCADAFEFVAPQPCDAAINWFTSFGYNEDDEQNIRMMHRVFESLRPGGGFILDYVNLPRMFADFRPSMVDRPKGGAGLEGLLVLHENNPDFARGMMRSDWTFLHPDGRRVERHIATRMYMPHDLINLLQRSGFIEPRLFGWIDGEAFSRTARRCMVAARKPG